MLTRMLAGAPQRKTRFHDELGHLVSPSRALRHAPAAFATGLLRLLIGYRSIRPWISYDAQRLLGKLLTPESRVLEFGSGMSTLWYAGRAGEVVSIEDYSPWFSTVSAMIARRRVNNVRYRFAADATAYTTLSPAERGDGFDLVMVDGSARDLCVRRSLELLRPGGMMYLDNSDKGADERTGDVPAARRMLLAAARERGATVTYFTDFAPTQLFVQQGMLVQMPR